MHQLHANVIIHALCGPCGTSWLIEVRSSLGSSVLIKGAAIAMVGLGNLLAQHGFDQDTAVVTKTKKDQKT